MVPVRRHAGHWRAYLTGGGLVLVIRCLLKRLSKNHNTGAPNQGKDRSPGKDNGDGYQADSSEQIGRFLERVDTFIGHHQTHYEERKGADEDNRKIAKRTFWVGFAAASFAFVAALGAGGSAYFAWRQVSDAKEQEVRQLRAYMYEAQLTITINKYPVPDSGTTIIPHVKFLNGGFTPAYRVSLVERAGPIFGFNESSIHAIDVLWPTAKVDAAYAFKDQGIVGEVPPIRTYSPAEITGLIQGIDPIYAYWGELTWYDVFQQPHWLHFCYEISSGGGFSNDPSYPEGPRKCPFYNEEDEDD